jgi:hypothetical protein
VGVKRPGREAYYSPTSNVEVKNGGAIRLLTMGLHVAALTRNVQEVAGNEFNSTCFF